MNRSKGMKKFLKDAYGTTGLKAQFFVGMLVAMLSMVGALILHYSVDPTMTTEILKQCLGGLIGLGLGAALIPMLQEWAYNKFG